jgi:hypothetical protein
VLFAQYANEVDEVLVVWKNQIGLVRQMSVGMDRRGYPVPIDGIINLMRQLVKLLLWLEIFKNSSTLPKSFSSFVGKNGKKTITASNFIKFNQYFATKTI